MGASPPRTVSCEGDEEGDEYVRFTVSVTRRKMREVLVGWLFGDAQSKTEKEKRLLLELVRTWRKAAIVSAAVVSGTKERAHGAT